MQVRLKPAAPQSRVKRSTIKPLRSLTQMLTSFVSDKSADQDEVTLMLLFLCLLLLYWCLCVIGVLYLFLAVPWSGLRSVIKTFPVNQSSDPV